MKGKSIALKFSDGREIITPNGEYPLEIEIIHEGHGDYVRVCHDNHPISITFDEIDYIHAEIHKDEKNELAEALKDLYEHTKNNHQIHGINAKARAALKRAGIEVKA